MARKVEVLGAAGVSKALADVDRDIALYGKAGKQAAVIVAQAAASSGPNVSGDLSRSYKGMGGKTQGRVVSRAAHRKGRKGDGFYAAVIEWGWPGHNIAPQMRIQRALKAKETVIRALFEEHCRNVIASKGLKGK